MSFPPAQCHLYLFSFGNFEIEGVFLKKGRGEGNVSRGLGFCFFFFFWRCGDQLCVCVDARVCVTVLPAKGDPRGVRGG